MNVKVNGNLIFHVSFHFCAYSNFVVSNEIHKYHSDCDAFIEEGGFSEIKKVLNLIIFILAY